jgi:hypothetical protein
VRPVELVITPRAVRDEKRIVAVLGLDSNHLAGDFAQSLVPRNADELPLAALPHSFERVQQSIGMILSPQIGTSAGAGAQLRSGYRVGSVIRIQADDFSILDVRDQQTTSAAVVGGAADADGGRHLHLRQVQVWTVDGGMRNAHIPSVGDMSVDG